MKYLCLVYYEEALLAALSPGEREALVCEGRDYEQDLLQRGRFLAADALEPAWEATTIRLREGQLTITAGSPSESHAQLGQFVLIDARDLNDAIRVIAAHPQARLGCVEVRPLRTAGPR